MHETVSPQPALGVLRLLALEFDWLPDEWTRHAVSTSATELSASDLNDLDAYVARGRVTVVSINHPCASGNQAAAASPLLPLAGIGVASGWDDTKLVEPQRLGDHIRKWPLLQRNI